MKLACLPGLALFACMAAGAQVNTYTVTPIIDDTQDEFLINPWGMSRPVNPSLREGEWWLSDNGTGFTTLYDASKMGAESLLPLFITIPTASGAGVGSPTGTAYNRGPLPGPDRTTLSSRRSTERSRTSTWARSPPLAGRDATSVTSLRQRSR
jgi:hypothetical protein